MRKFKNKLHSYRLEMFITDNNDSRLTDKEQWYQGDADFKLIGSVVHCMTEMREDELLLDRIKLFGIDTASSIPTYIRGKYGHKDRYRTHLSEKYPTIKKFKYELMFEVRKPDGSIDVHEENLELLTMDDNTLVDQLRVHMNSVNELAEKIATSLEIIQEDLDTMKNLSE